MPYNNYIPQFYQPQYMPVQSGNQQNVQQNYSGINWVQGENAAKSYPVAAGQSALLMDSENPVMYIKSTDQSGMPLPLRIFDYTERVPNSNKVDNANQSENPYVTKQEFEDFKEEIRSDMKRTRIIRNSQKEVEKGT